MKNKKHTGIGIILLLLLSSWFQSSQMSIAFAGKDNSCSHEIPLDQAAAILGVAAGDLNHRSYEQPVSPENQKNKTYKFPPCIYRYRSKSDFLKSINYTVYDYNSSQKARSVFNTMRSNFETVAKVEAVSGLGDQAFWVNDDRFHRLVTIRGTVMIDVVSPKTPEVQKRIARFLLDR